VSDLSNADEIRDLALIDLSIPLEFGRLYMARAESEPPMERSMKYLLLAYHDENRWALLPPNEKEAIVAASRPFDDELRRSGHLVAMGSLPSRLFATALRTRNGKLLTTDGPYVETREHLDGFMLIEARDLNEAIRVASNHPAAKMGEQLGWGVEVWPFERFENSG
jgi:hypothetical protein